MCCRRTLIVVSKAAMLCVALSVAGSQCNPYEQSAERDRIPPAVIERLRMVVTEKAPDVKITIEDDDHGGGCRFVERCEPYLVHGVNGKTGGFGKKSSGELGPSANGFLIELNWKSKLGGGAGWPLPPLYWDRGTYCYELPGESGYVCLSWAYGIDTDLTILDAVRAELAAFGELVDDYDAGQKKWDEKSASLRETVTDVLNKYQTKAKWRADGKSLVCEFNTMEFDVHAIDENQHVSPEAHKETGPDRDGFIIRLSPLQVALRGQPRTMCGVSQGPYWQHYFAHCDEYSQPFRLDILYGESTDQKLFKEVTEKLNGQIGMFQSF